MDIVQDHKDRCRKCNACIRVCPQYDDFSIVTDLYGYISSKNGRLPKDDIRKCFTCNVCASVCPEDLGIRKLISLAREKRTKENGISEVQRIADPFSDKNMYLKIGTWKKPLQFKNEMKKADVVYFPGCAATCMNQIIGRATVSVLDAANVDYSVLSGVDYCCGSVSFGAGNPTPLKKMGPKNIEKLKELGAKTVITTCPGCYRAFKNIYPEMFGPLPFETLQTSEFFYRLIQENRLSFDEKNLKLISSKNPIRLFYQDPCHLTRGVGIYEEPRKALSSVPGIVLTNPSPKGSVCCGFGGGVRTTYPDLSLNQARRVHEIARLNESDVIVTNCGGCMKNVIEGKTDSSGNEYPGSAKVYDFAEFLALAAGSDPIDRNDYMLVTLSNRALLESLDCYNYDRYGWLKIKKSSQTEDDSLASSSKTQKNKSFAHFR